jgi:hypothetical protein
MDRSTTTEIIAGVVLVGLLVLFVNPYMFWMPSVLTYCVLGLVLVGFGVFGGMVWHERPRDEREELHAMRASRFAYLAGLGVLVAGAVYQAATAMMDKWLFAAIAVMVLVKLATRFHANRAL